MTNSNAWEIEIRNFQSIKHAKIEVCDGLNVITGKTNSGKSAIFRAINASIFNSGTDDLVQAGQDIASVTISNGEHTMSYARNAKGKNEKTAYKFDNNKVIRKVGRTQLPEVAQMFGIKEVQMQNNVKIRLNFWYQNEKPFLMGNTSGQLFEFLSLSSADKYFKILKSMKADLKVQDAEINNSNTTIDTLKMVNNQKEEFLDSNKGFDDLYTQIITVGAEVDKLNKCLGIIELLKNLGEQIHEVNDKLDKVNKIYQSIPIKDITKQYQCLIDSDGSYTKLFNSLVSLSQTKKQIGIVQESVNNITPKYENHVNALTTFSGYLTSLDELNTSISYMQITIPKCVSLQKNIGDLTSKISTMKDSNIDLSSIQSGIDNLVSVYETQQQINKAITNLNTIEVLLNSFNKSISEVSGKLDTSNKELEVFKSQVGYCPFCGSVFESGKQHSHMEV